MDTAGAEDTPTRPPSDQYAPTREHRHQALGWLINAIESELPGFVLRQSDIARRDNPEIAAVFEDWAARLAPTERAAFLPPSALALLDLVAEWAGDAEEQLPYDLARGISLCLDRLSPVGDPR